MTVTFSGENTVALNVADLAPEDEALAGQLAHANELRQVGVFERELVRVL